MTNLETPAKVFTIFIRVKKEWPSLQDEAFLIEERLTTGISSWDAARTALRNAGYSMREKWKAVVIEQNFDGETEMGYFYRDGTDEKAMSDAMEEQRQRLAPFAYEVRDFLIELGCFVTALPHRIITPPTETICFQVSVVSHSPDDAAALLELLSAFTEFEITDYEDVGDAFQEFTSRAPETIEELMECHSFVSQVLMSSQGPDDAYNIIGFPDNERRSQFLRFGKRDNETLDQWVARVAMPTGRLQAAIELLERHGSFNSLFKSQAKTSGLFDKDDHGPSDRWLVPKLLPLSTLVLLAGEKKRGKSALALQLCIALAESRSWLGFETESEGFVVYVTGEDGAKQTMRRAHRMTGEDRLPERLVIVEARNPKQLHELIEDLINDRTEIDLLVVDPVMKFLDGDEKQSNVMNAFFAPLERLIEAVGASVVIVHHVLKDAHPQSVNEVYAKIRGSGVIADRPRLAWALARSKAGKITFGIPTNHGTPQHNGLPGEYHEETIELIQDPADTILHLPAISGANSKQEIAQFSASEVELVLNAVERINAESGKITRTGSNGLFEQSPPELEGMSRANVRAILSQLIADGVLVVEKGVIVTEECLAA